LLSAPENGVRLRNVMREKNPIQKLKGGIRWKIFGNALTVGQSYKKVDRRQRI
jgi:hypothetical protein